MAKSGVIDLLQRKSKEELASAGLGEEEEKPKQSQADILIELALSSAFLFHDDLQETFARIGVNGHGEIWSTRSQFFKRWLVGKYYGKTGKAPNGEAITQALNVIEAKAFFEGPGKKLSLRVAAHDGAFWYDLADSTWRVVQITSDGWKVTNKPPILFRRYKNTAPQVEPIAEKDGLWRLFDFINLPKLEDRYLLMIYIVTCLIPDIPHVIPPFAGEKGAAKSTTLRVLRRLVDPANRELLTLPNDKNELALLLSSNYMPAFDNLDNLQGWQSDILCCAATGGGISKRTLYTDSDETILSFLRCVTLNGISLVANRSDLLDRSILFELERIPPEKRREESEFWEEFMKARPYILGAAFDALSGAMRIYPTVKLSSLPRMADFCRWGYAVAEALGIGGEYFLRAYQDNIGRANEEAINSNPVATALLAFMASRTEWEGTARGLLDSLQSVARDECINTMSKAWPQEANALSRRLKHAKSNLMDSGITYEQYRESGGNRTRKLIFRKVAKVSSQLSHSVQPSSEAGLWRDDTGDDMQMQ